MFSRFLAVFLLLFPLMPRALERVEIVPDHQAGTATVAIDGVPVLKVTSGTVFVSGDLVFSGAISRRPVGE